ncbi:Histone-lysine N-methyltransferase SETMAR [Eumeta japonica]|uniref:Histone-lysine N-methyltransferase SETMAR n=1 Tax=Eumeta variegata TaxID=151549 RepID=A0A4C1VJU9_EUMVA|nr:Histone-lysine N-methyltransferase SETMAR [Eumeta japonica]
MRSNAEPALSEHPTAGAVTLIGSWSRLGFARFLTLKAVLNKQNYNILLGTDNHLLPKKFDVSFSTENLIGPLFWDSKGMVMIEYLDRGANVTDSLYAKQLKKLRNEFERLGSNLSILHIHLTLPLGISTYFRGETINSDLYCQQLMRLKQEIKKKWPEFINRKNMVFHDDNARRHKCLTTQQILREFDWEALMHPP